MKDRFFVYCNESGFELFETLDDALDAANERIQGYLEDAWSDEVTSVCAGAAIASCRGEQNALEDHRKQGGDA